MNENIEIDMKNDSDETKIDKQKRIELDGLVFRRKIVITCVGLEFLAIVAVLCGVTPDVFLVAIGFSTMSGIFAFILAWRVRSFAGMALATLNALTVIRLWSVPWLISDGGLSKYLFIAVLLVRVIGWVALLIINRRVHQFLERQYSAENGRP